MALFDGPEWIFGLTGNGGAGQVVGSWGSGTADGAGNFTLGVVQETNPPPTFGLFGWSYPVTVDAARVFTWQLPPGTDFYRGGISANGNLGALASIGVGGLPQLFFSVRRNGTFSNASLNGAYHLCGFEGAGPTVAIWGSVTFDGVGTVAGGPITVNSDGVVLGGAIPAQPYTVAANGLFSSFGGTSAGGVLAGGDLAVLGGASGGPGRLLFFVRRSTAASAATLSGSYFVVGIERDATGYTSSTGTLVSDGVGTMTLALTQNDDGVVAAAPAFPSPYTVAPNGTLVAGPFQGGVAPSGDFAVVAGSTTPGSFPGLFFLLR